MAVTSTTDFLSLFSLQQPYYTAITKLKPLTATLRNVPLQCQWHVRRLNVVLSHQRIFTWSTVFSAEIRILWGVSPGVLCNWCPEIMDKSRYHTHSNPIIGLDSTFSFVFKGRKSTLQVISAIRARHAWCSDLQDGPRASVQRARRHGQRCCGYWPCGLFQYVRHRPHR